MSRYLIVRLQGLFQAWGRHTFETYRPTEVFPTRSGITGLLGACLGLKRTDFEALRALDLSYSYGVRVDGEREVFIGISDDGTPQKEWRGYTLSKLNDFHTAQNVRTVGGSNPKETEITHREYLEDLCCTVAIAQRAENEYGLDRLREALQNPCFTPFLGRRSCPLARPLLEDDIDAASLNHALLLIPPGFGTIYSEEPMRDDSVMMRVRDVPVFGRYRQFETRYVYVSNVTKEEAHHVSQ
ncbi:MAG: type I-E CRISPR-associated protein Cas5/CasD [Dethiosulfovibrio peptidovorans]|nr:MAG: type I-E CRISPR-associated protein Cas5/CasD [Dethiosulfovibrio peptidovorans]